MAKMTYDYCCFAKLVIYGTMRYYCQETVNEMSDSDYYCCSWSEAGMRQGSRIEVSKVIYFNYRKQELFQDHAQEADRHN